MNKGFLKGLLMGFAGAAPLYLFLNILRWILEKVGIIKSTNNNPILILSILIVSLVIYFILIRAYFKHNSSKNLEKLYEEMEKSQVRS